MVWQSKQAILEWSPRNMIVINYISRRVKYLNACQVFEPLIGEHGWSDKSNLYLLMTSYGDTNNTRNEDSMSISSLNFISLCFNTQVSYLNSIYFTKTLGWLWIQHSLVFWKRKKISSLGKNKNGLSWAYIPSFYIYVFLKKHWMSKLFCSQLTLSMILIWFGIFIIIILII